MTSENAESYQLLGQTSGIEETRNARLQRHLPYTAGLDWLAAGWRDFWNRPGSSLAYGFVIFLLSLAFLWTLFAFGRDYILFPALAGFLIVAPFLADQFRVVALDSSGNGDSGSGADLGGKGS